MVLTKIYKRYVPASIRIAVYNLFLGSFLRVIRKRKRIKLESKLHIEIPLFYENELNRGIYPDEYYSAAQWIKKNGYRLIPYDFIFEYDSFPVNVFECKESGLKYVLHEGKRMYFPKRFSSNQCKRYYRWLLAEQDRRSPHRYYYECFDKERTCTVFDIGAAEGIFTLNVIDQISKAYLFECDDLWLRALRMTFKPYGDKVEIINKYVSDTDSDTSVTLDSFMRNKPLINGYIKMDIEGAELHALKGADSLLKDSKVRFISACTYHLAEIGKDIGDYLGNYHYECSYTPGIMAFGEKPPYFRRGVLYASK